MNFFARMIVKANKKLKKSNICKCVLVFFQQFPLHQLGGHETHEFVGAIKRANLLGHGVVRMM